MAVTLNPVGDAPQMQPRGGRLAVGQQEILDIGDGFVTAGITDAHTAGHPIPIIRPHQTLASHHKPLIR